MDIEQIFFFYFSSWLRVLSSTPVVLVSPSKNFEVQGSISHEPFSVEPDSLIILFNVKRRIAGLLILCVGVDCRS